MNKIKSIWTSITGSISSIIPLFFACCKSGACVGVCASPVASLFGISSATLMASPLVQALEPLLIAISAVAFTISYYDIYVLPKSACATDCACDVDDAKKSSINWSKWIFWIGLIASIAFFTYFEVQKYKSNASHAPIATSCSTASTCDTTSSCCVADTVEVEEKACCSGDKKCE